MRQLLPYEFGIVVHGLVTFGCDIPPRWMEEAMDYFERHISKFRIQSLCYALQSLVKYVTLYLKAWCVRCLHITSV